MRSFFAIIEYFYTSSRFIKPLAISGLVFLLPSIVVSSQEFKTVLFLAGWFLTFGVPYLFVSQSSFWLLIANRRLSMVPGFHIKAGLVLFVFTLVVSQLTIFLTMYWSPLLALKAFNIATLMLIVASLSQKTYGLSVWITLGLFSLDSVGLMFDTYIAQFLLFFISAVIWAYGFICLANKKDFRGLAINYVAILTTEDPFGENSQIFKNPKKKQSKMATLNAIGVLNRSGRSIVAHLRLATIPMFIFPVTISFIIAISNFSEGSLGLEMSEGWIKLYLFISMMTPALISATYSKKVKDLRQMWLRVEGSRENIWGRLEQEIRPEVFGLIACLIINFAIAVLFTNLSLFNCLTYCAMTIGMYFYGVYVGCLIGCDHKSGLGSLLLVIYPSIFFCVPLLFLIDFPIVVMLVLLVFLMTVGLTRYFAKQKFTVIDWFSVNPFRQLSRQLYLRSSNLNQQSGGS